MYADELRNKSPEELAKIAEDLKAQLFMLRFQNSTGQLDQPHKISEIKKDIARVMSVRSEQRRGAVVKSAKKSRKQTTETRKKHLAQEEKAIKAKEEHKTKEVKKSVKGASK